MTTNKLTPAEEEQIREVQRAYHQEYYKKNKKKILENHKRWRKENPEKIKKNNRNYWLRKAEKLNQEAK